MTQPCPSTIHDQDGEHPHPNATVAGVLHTKRINDRPDVPVTYCQRCAGALGSIGWFTATDTELGEQAEAVFRARAAADVQNRPPG